MSLTNKRFRPALLSAAIAASVTSVGAFAQDDETAALEEVTVTGIRSSVLDSVSAKRESDVVAEVIDAGDLASLPDVSIADALGRLPGVTTVRDSGQSSQLNIRGMNGDFVQTSLNGREQASTSGYTAGSRWIAFDQYPSELITQAAVYKSPKASLIEGGVAGTVEMKTANPLEAEKQHNFNANVRYSFNDAAENVGADEAGRRVSFSYQGKFLDETLGVAVGYADLSQPNSAEHMNSFIEGSRDFDGDGSEDRIIKGFQLRAENGQDERQGYLASVVWEPTDAISAQFDYFRSDFSSEDTRSGFYVDGLQRDASTYDIDNAVVQDGILTGGDVTLTTLFGPWIEVRQEDQSTDSLTESFGFKFDWQITDTFNAKMDIAHSSGEKTRLDRIASLHAYDLTYDADGNLQAWQELGGQSLGYQLNAGDMPSVAFNTDYTDLSHMRLGDWEQFPHLYTDELDSVKFDFKYEVDMPVVASFEAGVRWSERVFSDDRSTFRWGRREGQNGFVDADGNVQLNEGCEFNRSDVACMPMDLDGFVTVESFGGSMSGYPNYLSVDLAGIADAVFGPGNYDAQQTWDHNWTLIESGELKEEVVAYYFMANLDTEMFGIPVTGNAGVRVVETDTKSIGIQQVRDGEGDEIIDDNGVARYDYAHVEYGPEYTDVLPSLNLSFHITEQDQVRFAAAKVMGRPPVFQLRGGAGSWIDTANDGVSPRYNVWSKGNPNLDPFRANQFDLSYEHYFEDGGAVTAAVFYKDIESLIENVTYFEGDIAWSEIGLEAPAGLVEGQYQTTRNNDMGGYIRGLELAYTDTFDQLPGIFAGLGMTSSYSYTESETAVDGGGNFPDQVLPLPGLSKNVWSTSVFWDIGNFSTNMNVRYRDEFAFAGVSPGGSSLTMADEYTTVDWQSSYSFDNGVDVLFQVNNLTNEPNIATYGTPSAVAEYAEYGRQYFMGVSYQF
ncbi:TonB-dependent receptor [Microbulbifer agarilyticus]|uniref:TonB-dependent receptor n=1 Tax=Microbulbifer agarilyticus TaxID=260552 RepID=UPI001CD2ABAC|nr:TonB-dependent receptor [Microbulbifer agarilyticus]MCA0894622.1 TonB-dependent receptor [Microbulbifer agarilyticus]